MPSTTRRSAPLCASSCRRQVQREADQVAAGLVAAVDRGRPLAYLPRRWRKIMFVIRNMPRRLFDKLDLQAAVGAL